MILPGTYQATILNHSISETKGGDPQAVVTFSFDTNDGPKQIMWFGSFKEKAIPITLKALLICGLKGSNPAGPLQIGKEVSIELEKQTALDGKSRMKVKWINQLNAGRSQLPQDLAKAKLSSLEGAVMAARQNLNIPDEDESDIPF